jgi:hypothetical protein
MKSVFYDIQHIPKLELLRVLEQSYYFGRNESPKGYGLKQNHGSVNYIVLEQNESHKRLRAKTKSQKHKLNHFGRNGAPKRLKAKIKPRKLKINREASISIDLSHSKTKIQCISQCFRARN